LALFCKAQEVLGRVIKRIWGQEAEMIATSDIIDALALSGMPRNMLPLEGETLTQNDIDLFERAQAAQANKPLVPPLAAPSGGSGQPPSAMPTDLAAPLVPPPASSAPTDVPMAPSMRQLATKAGFQLGSGILQPPPQPAPSDDPFANLSKTQRRMLAFAAMSDAGAALAGKQGGNFASTLSAFNDMADMQRKRTAAAQRQQMLQRVMGGAGVGMGDMSNLELKKQQLIQQAYAFPDMAPAIKMQIDQINEQIEKSRASVSAAGGASETLETVEDLLRTVRETEGTTGFWGAILGNIPFTAAGELRIDAQTLRSNMALQALMDLKASGATLGSVSEKELELLESDIAKLNLNQSKEAVLKDLNKIKGRYQKAIRFAYKEPNADTAALDRVLGGRPTWLEGDNGGGEQLPDPLNLRNP
jgi:hypothetical protein